MPNQTNAVLSRAFNHRPPRSDFRSAIPADGWLPIRGARRFAMRLDTEPPLRQRSLHEHVPGRSRTDLFAPLARLGSRFAHAATWNTRGHTAPGAAGAAIPSELLDNDGIWKMDFKDLADEQARFISSVQDMLEALTEFSNVCTAKRPDWDAEPFVRAIEVQRKALTQTALQFRRATSLIRNEREAPPALH